MTTYDEDSTARLVEFVQKVGSTRGLLSVAELEFRIEVLTDPEWLDFLDLTEIDAAKSLRGYRSLLAQTRKSKVA